MPRHPKSGPVGTLVAAHKSGPAPQLQATQIWRFLYRSNSQRTAKTATRLVSGQVLIPRGSPPKGGWPVIAWAHGTTGLTSKCSPSLVPGLTGDSSAVSEINTMLAQGWAVVATDYAGLGTPGTHPYLIGAANASDVLAALSAAHQLSDAKLARSFLIVGHSEGGQTALFAAQRAASFDDKLDYRGTVALAPASTLEALLPLAQATRDPVDEAYAIYALKGLETIDPSVKPDSYLSTQARKALGDVRSGCVDQITNHLAALNPDPFLNTSRKAIDDVSARIGRHDDPDRAKAAGPILVEQGTSDRGVPAPATDGMVQRLCALGDNVTYHHVAGVDHEQLLPASKNVVTGWIRDRIAGQATTGNCPAR